MARFLVDSNVGCRELRPPIAGRTAKVGHKDGRHRKLTGLCCMTVFLALLLGCHHVSRETQKAVAASSAPSSSRLNGTEGSSSTVKLECVSVKGIRFCLELDHREGRGVLVVRTQYRPATGRSRIRGPLRIKLVKETGDVIGLDLRADEVRRSYWAAGGSLGMSGHFWCSIPAGTSIGEIKEVVISCDGVSRVARRVVEQRSGPASSPEEARSLGLHSAGCQVTVGNSYHASRERAGTYISCTSRV